jgi:hypothetical protein
LSRPPVFRPADKQSQPPNLYRKTGATTVVTPAIPEVEYFVEYQQDTGKLIAVF